MPYSDPEDKKRSDSKRYYRNRERLRELHRIWVESNKDHLIDYERNRKRVCVKGKHFKTKTNRIGVCNMCRAVAEIDCAYTHLAHFSYDYNDLGKNVMELCPRCHKHIDGFKKDLVSGRFVTKVVD